MSNFIESCTNAANSVSKNQSKANKLIDEIKRNKIKDINQLIDFRNKYACDDIEMNFILNETINLIRSGFVDVVFYD